MQLHGWVEDPDMKAWYWGHQYGSGTAHITRCTLQGYAEDWHVVVKKQAPHCRRQAFLSSAYTVEACMEIASAMYHGGLLSCVYPVDLGHMVCRWQRYRGDILSDDDARAAGLLKE